MIIGLLADAITIAQCRYHTCKSCLANLLSYLCTVAVINVFIMIQLHKQHGKTAAIALGLLNHVTQLWLYLQFISRFSLTTQQLALLQRQ